MSVYGRLGAWVYARMSLCMYTYRERESPNNIICHRSIYHIIYVNENVVSHCVYYIYKI